MVRHRREASAGCPRGWARSRPRRRQKSFGRIVRLDTNGWGGWAGDQNVETRIGGAAFVPQPLGWLKEAIVIPQETHGRIMGCRRAP
jgi:hypothetical protein